VSREKLRLQNQEAVCMYIRPKRLKIDIRLTLPTMTKLGRLEQQAKASKKHQAQNHTRHMKQNVQTTKLLSISSVFPFHTSKPA
jgi:hypothetical protein